MSSKILVYGANGFTGQLVISQLCTPAFQDLQAHGIVIAGRNRAKLEPLMPKNEAGKNFELRVFGLDKLEDVENGLKDVEVVLHMAGPYFYTSKTMLDACIRRGAHYIDITGEQEVLTNIHESRNTDIRDSRIYAVPGCGFDVVPTDCLAVMLKKRLPTATHLDLAIMAVDGKAGISKGTTRTIMHSLTRDWKPGARIDGKIVPRGLFGSTKMIPFKSAPSPVKCGFLPQGDCVTAGYSTGIPNVEVYIPMPPVAVGTGVINSVLGTVFKHVPFALRATDALINTTVKGPSDTIMSTSRTEIYGSVLDTSNKARIQASLIIPECYHFTALAVLHAARRLLEERVEIKEFGAYTPAQLFGDGFVEGIEGVDKVVFETKAEE